MCTPQMPGAAAGGEADEHRAAAPGAGAAHQALRGGRWVRPGAAAPGTNQKPSGIFFCAVRVSPRILQTAVPRARRFAKAQRRHSAIGNCEHALPRPGTAGTRGPRRVAPSGSARKLGLSTSNASRQLAGDFQVLFSLCAESTSSSRGEQCAYECLSRASLDCSERGSCGCMAS